MIWGLEFRRVLFRSPAAPPRERQRPGAAGLSAQFLDLAFKSGLLDPKNLPRPGAAAPSGGPRVVAEALGIGRASCRERGEISGGGGSLKKKRADAR